MTTDTMRGFTLHDVNGIAKAATVAAGHAATNFRDRYDEAWSAIVEALFTAEQPPTGAQLWHAGRDAVLQAIRDDRRHYGAPTSDRDADLASARGWVRYWSTVVTPDPAPAVVERYAAFQIWPMLTPAHQDALQVLAAAGDVGAAAAALAVQTGISEPAARTRIQRARDAFRALWHQHETPGRQRKPGARRDDAELAACGTPQAYRRHKKRGEPVDDPCRDAYRAAGREQMRARRAASVTSPS